MIQGMPNQHVSYLLSPFTSPKSLEEPANTFAVLHFLLSMHSASLQFGRYSLPVPLMEQRLIWPNH